MDNHAKLAEIKGWIANAKRDATIIDWNLFETYEKWLIGQLSNESGLMDYKAAVKASLDDLRTMHVSECGLGKLVAGKIIAKRASYDHEC